MKSQNIKSEIYDKENNNDVLNEENIERDLDIPMYLDMEQGSINTHPTEEEALFCPKKRS
jgi:hypothetical protein